MAITRYHVTMADDSGGFSAQALAHSAGGNVRSTVQRYNDQGNDLALIDIDAADEPGRRYLEQLLNDDENVLSYRTSEHES